MEKRIKDFKATPNSPYAFENSVKIDEIMDTPILIHRFFIQHKNYQGNKYDAMTFEFSHPDSPDVMYTSQTSSSVLIAQFTEQEVGKPFSLRAKISKVKNYFTLIEA